MNRDEGILLGTLFTAPGVNTHGTDCQRAILSSREAERIVATEGRALVDQYWGNYVAFIRRRGDDLIRVIRAPFARLSCLHSAVDGVRMYASDMEIIAQLRIRLHSISWHALARTFLGPETPGASHLNEIREVPGGACEDSSGNRCQRYQLWSPSAIAAEPFHGSDSDAADALRSATRACVQAWAGEHSHVLVGISGGLDSSVTLSCTADTPSLLQVTAVTQFGEDQESDERVYARLMARRARCELIEVPRTTDADLRHCEYSAVFECSPGLHLPSIDRIEPDIANRLGATAIFRGHGGDELFCRNQTSLYLMDFLHQRGMKEGFFDLLTHAAHTEGTTVWSILARAMWNAWRPAGMRGNVPRNQLAPEVFEGSLLHRHVLHELTSRQSAERGKWARMRHEEARTTHGNRGSVAHRTSGAHTQENGYGHGHKHWYRHGLWREHEQIASLPPGRSWQLHLLLARRNLTSPFDRERDPEVICPLLSQPLVELCLRIPTWLQMTRHTDRALTRKAFANDLPPEILNRTDKGGAEHLATEILCKNLPYLRERLLDGLIVQSGIIDRTKLEASLSPGPSPDAVNSAPIFELLGAELWANAWRHFNARQNCTFTVKESVRNSSTPSRLA